MTAKLRAAVIGAGQIAKQHLAALRATPQAELVGVCDLSPVLAESTAERFGIPRWFVNHRQMLDQTRPDVVHVATPAGTHYALAKESLEADRHVFVEKPLTLAAEQTDELLALAAQRGRWLIEDHNYLFNDDVRQLLLWRDLGKFGAVRHVDAQICLDLFAPGSRFADPDLPHPAMEHPLGAASDFITHLTYLAYAFIGPHRGFTRLSRAASPQAPHAASEFRLLVDGRDGTALVGLSAGSGPDAFLLRVQGERMRAEVNLFECGVVVTEAVGGPKPLAPIRAMRRRGAAERRNSWRSLTRKLGGGPGPYEGLRRLIQLTYEGLAGGGPPPLSRQHLADVNRLVHAVEAEAVA